MKRRSMMILIGGSLVLFLFLTALATTNQGDEVNAPQKLIKSVALLEQRPLDNKTKEVRSWAIKWITETDKVSVKVCSLLVSGIDRNYHYGSEVIGQYTIGMAAFKLANPAKASDEDAAQLFGVESALTVYATIIRTHPDDRNAFLDDLATKRSKGDLSKFVAEHNCQ